MSDKNKSIHEFDLEVICEYFFISGTTGAGQPRGDKKSIEFH